MSKYTTTLDQLIRGGFDIGLKDYPIFEETHRTELNEKIIAHYRYREIGLETPAMFKFMLNRTMGEIMPYYNQLYKAQSEIDSVSIFDNYNLTEKVGESTSQNQLKTDTKNESANTTNVGEGNSTTSTTSTDDTNSLSKVQRNDTPMGKLTDIYKEDYATETTQTTNNGNTTTTGLASGHDETKEINESVVTGQYESGVKTDGTRGILRTMSGKNSGESYLELLEKAKNAIVNIDMMVINELETCFMQLW